MKEEDFEKYKASQLRSNWLRRAKSIGQDVTTVPTGKEIRAWLHTQRPYTCFFSGESLGRDFGIDHKQPLSRGGTFALDNICITSLDLNAAKGAMTLKEFKELLKLISTWEEGGKELLLRLKASNIYFTQGR